VPDYALDKLTASDLQPHLHEAFSIEHETGALVVELIEVTEQERRDVPEDRRAPFSVVFRGPRDPWLSQGIYEVANASMGTIAMFLVPIVSDHKGQRYEAVFA